MDKQQYKNLINETTWQWVKNHFDSIENYEPSVLCSLDINPKQWIEFSVEQYQNLRDYTKMLGMDFIVDLFFCENVQIVALGPSFSVTRPSCLIFTCKT